MDVVSTARSLLFVPGDRPDRFGKAAASGADAVILDLEDAVAPGDKPAARYAVADWLQENHALVRINAADSEFHAEDVRTLAGAPGLRGIVLPKSERAEELVALTRAVPGELPVVALVETALGVHEATTLARVPGVVRLAFGSLDFALDAGTGTGHEELLYARSRLVLASRVAGIAAPVDGVTPVLDDPMTVSADAHAAARLGFGGKLAIHPKQLVAINEGFAPTDGQLQWAERMLDAVSAAGAGAVQVDGQMVDRPRVELARRISAARRSRKPPAHGS